MALVVDASVTIAWCIPDEHSAAADEILDSIVPGEGALVPGLWRSEVANVLLGAERRGRITESGVARALALLEALGFEVAADPSSAELVALGRLHGLTAYDAAYLCVALESGGALATFDGRLAAAARVAGVPVVGAS